MSVDIPPINGVAAISEFDEGRRIAAGEHVDGLEVLSTPSGKKYKVVTRACGNQEGDGWIASAPLLRGCWYHGSTKTDAASAILEQIEHWDDWYSGILNLISQKSGISLINDDQRFRMIFGIGNYVTSVEPPSNNISGYRKAHKAALKLVEIIEPHALELIQLRDAALAYGFDRYIELNFSSDRESLIDIYRCLKANLDGIRPKKSRGPSQASSFVRNCCKLAVFISLKTGLSISDSSGSTRTDMIDIVTECMRPIPHAARRNPTIDAHERKNLNEPGRKGVADALREGRKLGLVS